MIEINWLLFSFISLSSFAILLGFILTERKHARKLLYLFLVLSIYIYSGVGMSIEGIENKYVTHYLVFIVVMLASIAFVFKYYDKRNPNGLFSKLLDEELLKHEKLYSLLSIVFLVTIFLNLIFPTIRIDHLWNPPKPSLINIFSRREELTSHPVLSVAKTLTTFLMPFFFINLYILRSKGNILKVILWLLIWLYLDYLSIGYWGRHEMVKYAVFIFFLLFSIRENKILVKGKYILIIGLAFIVAIPFFTVFEYLRLGSSVTGLSFKEAFSSLFISEATYPRFYTTIQNYTNEINPLYYILWILFLPIPSFIFSNKPGIIINEVFSTLVLGYAKGMDNYYVILPSILGESFFLWGMQFYWIHAIILGLLISLLCIFYEKSKIFSVISIFFIVQSLIIARGGSQGYLGILINSSISIFLWILFLKLKIRKR